MAGSSSIRRRWAVALAGFIGWAAIIGAAAGADTPPARWDDRPSLQTIATYGFIALLGLGLVLLVAMIVLGRDGGGGEQPKRRSIWRDLLLVVLFLVVLRLLRTSTGEEAPVEEEVTETGPSIDVPVASIRDLLALVLLVAIAGAFVIWARRQLQRPSWRPWHDDSQLTARELDPVVERTAHELRLGSDARSAVLRAYAGFETALGELGFGRQPSETPSEHVRRVLAAVPVDADPVARLAGLYERARYSDLPVTPTDRADAAVALDEVSSQLLAHQSGKVAGGDDT